MSGSSRAWIETSEGQKLPLGKTCSLGRSRSNDIVLKDEKISRRHALIHTQDKNEYWLVDFGSSNGTLLNGRRVFQPTRLRDQDRIELADYAIRFLQESNGPAEDEAAVTAQSTAHATRAETCWLLLADIVSSTEMSQKHAESELPLVLGKWFLEIKRLIEDNAGTINKFLGDGVFAYWIDQDGSDEKIRRVLRQLREARKERSPAFRVALHHGPVSIGGAHLKSEELMGRTVNFIFRMEKLGAKLDANCILSASARNRLQATADAKSLGEHPLQGFDGSFEFFTA